MSDLAYQNALAIMAKWLIEAAMSLPAQGGSAPGCSPQPGQVHPGAGSDEPADSPFQVPTGQSSLVLLAKTTTGSAG
jgi:hypothetical protein